MNSAATRPTKAARRSADAVAQWLGRRYKLTRPVDPATEVLVLNGTREGLFLAAIAAKRWVPARPENRRC